jgi:hypothetical protein
VPRPSKKQAVVPVAAAGVWAQLGVVAEAEARVEEVQARVVSVPVPGG